jgi:hypothetical protein
MFKILLDVFFNQMMENNVSFQPMILRQRRYFFAIWSGQETLWAILKERKNKAGQAHVSLVSGHFWPAAGF